MGRFSFEPPLRRAGQMLAAMTSDRRTIRHRHVCVTPRVRVEVVEVVGLNVIEHPSNDST